MNSVVNLKDGLITFNSNIDHSLSFSKCAIGYSNYNINSHERGSLVFLTNNNANIENISMNDIRMCIASDGNVGIGTNNPMSKLEVNGNINITAGSKYKINGYNLAYSNIDGPLPTAGIGTSGTLGGVKVDGSTITITNNVISATAQVNSDWNEISTASKAFILNKPTITAQVNSDWNEISAASKAFIFNKPTITAQVNSDWNEISTASKAFILNKPTITSSQWTTNGTNIYYSTGNIGIGTNAEIQSKLTINPIVIDRSSFNHSEAPLTITNPTATSSSVINDSKAVLHLCRQGTDSQACGARASFKLCRYENSSTNSRTRLDITLAHNTYDDLNIMSLQSGGNVGIGTENPQRRLHIQNHMRIGGSGPALDFGDDTNNQIYRNGITNELRFTTNAIDRLTIDASGLATFTGILQVNGDIRSNGNITAYFSDERLKTITEYVSDVLPTLSKLRVFRYNCNDLAASYGYDKNKKEIGLSAQEIQKYYPEVVSIAPFDAKYDEETKELISKSGEKYLTLDYERIVPILLQGIKDLNNIVEKMQENEKNMKNEINNIKLRLEKLEV